MKKETVGKVASDLLSKNNEAVNVIDQMREQLTDYEKNLFECVTTHLKIFNGTFYVVVITKKEPLMQNVIRNYFSARLSCPTPDYDQIVYIVNPKEEKLTFLWVVPSRDTCILLKENALKVHETEKQLLKFVLDFSDGTLFTIAKRLNKEE